MSRVSDAAKSSLRSASAYSRDEMDEGVPRGGGGRWRRSRRTTWSSAGTRSCATSRVIGHVRYLHRDGSGRSCGSTSSRATTRSGRSAATSAAGSTPSAKLENNYFGFGTDNDIEHTPGYVIIKHRTFGRAVPPSAPHVGRGGVAAVREGARRRARAAARVPARLGGQHLRDELRRRCRPTRSRRSTAAPRWPAACRTPARAASRPTTATAATWSARSAPATSAAATSTAASTSPGSRTPSPRRRCARSRSSSARAPSRGSAGVLPGVKVSPEIAATRGVPAGRRLRQPVAARGVRRRRRAARLRRDARRRDRAAGRHQVGGRRPGVLARAGRADGEHRPRGRLRHHRRRRGRHRRGAAGVHRLGEPAVPARASAGSTRSSPRPACTSASCSSAPASSGCPTTPSSRSRSARTW